MNKTMNEILQLALNQGKIKDISVYDYEDHIDVSLSIDKMSLLEMLRFTAIDPKTKEELKEIYPEIKGDTNND